MTQKRCYFHELDDEKYHEVYSCLSFLFLLLNFIFTFQLVVEVKLMPERGGDGLLHGKGVMNNTGSSVLTLLDISQSYLRDLNHYIG